MMLIFILIFTAISFFEAVSKARKNQRKEVASIITLTVLGICFAVFKMFNISTPIVVLKSLFYPLGRMVFRNH